ncbi:MAG: ASKHA domain-containing protein, partial [Spirochaetales bacterium]|nr:ASKHA domain-containing protein [Spirochaetales bacterium]
MKITISHSNTESITELEPGGTLLDAVNKAGIEGFDAPCGGKGTCGKCRVKVLSGVPAPASAELELLSKDELETGIRLACRVKPETDMKILISSAGKKAAIQTAFRGTIDSTVVESLPVYHRCHVKLAEPAIDDQRSDLKRLLDELSGNADYAHTEMPLDVMRRLPSVLREGGFDLTVSSCSGKITDIISGDKSEDYYAVAVDIGTTTVVSYLVSLAGSRRGRIIDFVSGLNSQKGYGGDVVSRIEYCMQAEGHLEELQRRITSQIDGMIIELSGRNNVDLRDIGLITIAGNTTMTHLFAGLDPAGIAAAPFIPVDIGLKIAPAAEFGLSTGSGCSCALLSGIASYVGADITSGIAATGMHESEELCLLIDIGTNGEIVLGSKDGMTACSTAAGPALEGANISCGMGGVPGAVNRLTAEERDDSEVFSFDVIGDVPAIGICGSGIVDAVAMFVKAGVLDETGRILSDDELAEKGVRGGWCDCVFDDDDGRAVRITDKLSITQKDIREIQMAKAAISAGVKTLLAETGKSTTDIKHLYIAGGFGAAMNKSSAAAVGLFPTELEAVVEIAGNTAGKGAVLAAISEYEMLNMQKIADDVNYIELSTSALFQQEYMMSMY